MFAPNSNTLKYMREKLTEFHRKINEYSITVGDFKIPLSVTDKSSKEKIREDTVELNSTINQLVLIDSIEYLTQQKKNIYLSQTYMGHSPK